MDILTKGCLQSIMDGINIPNPILKVITYKTLPSNTSIPRYRLNLTDGVSNNTYIMLATQLNGKITSGEVKSDTIIRLDNYIVKVQGDRKVIVLLGLTVVNVNEAINNPILGTSSRLEPNPMPVLQVAKQNQIVSGKAVPINLINCYQNKWRIEGRVSQKTPIKTFNNTKGEGKLFTFIICDATCDIKIAVFNNEVMKFFDMIQIGKTYSLTKGTIKLANNNFNTTKCSFEINLNQESEIVEIADNTSLPKMQLQFVSLDRVCEKEPNSYIDVVGIAHSIMDTCTVSTKSNKDVMKREIVLVDRSGFNIKMTLWGDSVNLLNNHVHPAIVVKGAVVKEFFGRTLSCGSSSTILINPSEIPEAMALVGWYNDTGAHMNFQGAQSSNPNVSTSSNLVEISQIMCNSNSDNGEYFTVNASISQIKRDHYIYKACMKCNKKLMDLNNGLFNCEKCKFETTDFNYSLILNMNIIDHTSSQWVTSFQQASEMVLGKTANELGNMVDSEQIKELDRVFKKALFKSFQLKLRAKNEIYNDEMRLKVTVVDVKTTDCLLAIDELLHLINV